MLRELLVYYTENKSALTGPYERGIEIPETRKPGVIHHARLGSMESNVFTLIGNRMKGRRFCWSIRGGNNLSNLLCMKHTTGLDGLFSGLAPLPEPEPVWIDNGTPLSSSKMPMTAGTGTEFYNKSTLPNIPWLKAITGYCSFADMKI